MSEMSNKEAIFSALVEGLSPNIHNIAKEIFQKILNITGPNIDLLKYALPMARRVIESKFPSNVDDFAIKIVDFLSNIKSPEIPKNDSLDYEAEWMSYQCDVFHTEYFKNYD